MVEFNFDDKLFGMGNFTLEERMEVYESLLPKTDFVIAMGTSHTYGSCRRDGNTRLLEKDTWTEVYSKKIGLPVINLGYPGVVNEIFVDILLTLLEFDTVKKYCKHIIMESRFCESSVTLGTDVLPYHPHNTYERLKENGNWWENLSATKHYQEELFHKKLPPELLDHEGKYKKQIQNSNEAFYKSVSNIDNMIVQRHPMPKRDSDLRDTLERNKSNLRPSSDWIVNDELENQFIEDIIVFKNIVRKIYFKSLAHQIHDYNNLRMMGELCNAHNIKFNWFCWDAKPEVDWNRQKLKHEEELWAYNDKNFQEDFIDRFAKVYPSYNKHEVKSLVKGATVTYLYETGELPPGCGCGHQTEVMHKWIAEKLFNDIGKK